LSSCYNFNLEIYLNGYMLYRVTINTTEATGNIN